MNTLTNAGLYLDNIGLGKDMLLVETAPYFEYVNKARTENILGYKYTVVLPQKSFEKLDVKIAGSKLLEVKPGESIAVAFKELKVRPYLGFRNDRAALMFTAEAASIVPSGNGKQ